MKFDITNIDKNRLLKILFEYSNPCGLGILEYEVRKEKGEISEFLSDSDCEKLLCDFNKSDGEGIFYISDYHNGKPMKVVFCRSKKGRITVSADGYDSRNGTYRFLESMLKNFPISEIFITEKKYDAFALHDLKKCSPHLIREKQLDKLYSDLIKNAIEKHNDLGRYWELQDILYENILRYNAISKL